MRLTIRSAVLIGAGAMLLTGCAQRSPDQEPPRPDKIAYGASLPADGTLPRWEEIPSAAEIFGVYPRAALRADIDGRAVIRCSVRADRRVDRCVLVEEQPPGQGFGEAALKLASRFRAAPADRAPGETVPITIRFRISD